MLAFIARGNMPRKTTVPKDEMKRHGIHVVAAGDGWTGKTKYLIYDEDFEEYVRSCGSLAEAIIASRKKVPSDALRCAPMTLPAISCISCYHHPSGVRHRTNDLLTTQRHASRQLRELRTRTLPSTKPRKAVRI